MQFDTASLVLMTITAVAAIVNGALGYGFSSLTVPVALLFYTNRVLNPTMVMVEVVINVFVLFMNRDSVPAVYKRVLPIIILAAIYARAGRGNEAKTLVQRLHQLEQAPRISDLNEWLPFQRPQDLEIFAGALREAGLPN